MKPSFSLVLGIWLAISGIASIPLSLIKWGNPERFHGQGVPIPSVLWERDRETGVWRDFPNPYSMVLNPLAIFAIGLVPVAPGWWVVRGFKARKKHSSPSFPEK